MNLLHHKLYEKTVDVTHVGLKSNHIIKGKSINNRTEKYLCLNG